MDDDAELADFLAAYNVICANMGIALLPPDALAALSDRCQAYRSGRSGSGSRLEAIAAVVRPQSSSAACASFRC